MNFSWPAKPKASFGALISRLFVLVSCVYVCVCVCVCVCVQGGRAETTLFVPNQWPTI